MSAHSIFCFYLSVVKLDRPLAHALISALQATYTEGRYPDKILEKTFKQHKTWRGAQRWFLADALYDILRWYRQLVFVARTSDDDYWGIVETWCILQQVELPRWAEFKNPRPATLKARLHEARDIRAVNLSIPDWLDAKGIAEMPKRWESEMKALNSKPRVVLRVNTLKSTKGELIPLLDEAGIQTDEHPFFKDALILPQWKSVFGLDAYKTGLFEVQDAASQAVAPFLDVEPGMRVIDACAGAGGKSLHLAALMENKGKLIAMDTEGWKLDELKRRARKCGVNNYETRVIDSGKAIKRLEKTADRVLLDVPCTGLGVLRRNPDAKWKLTEDYWREMTMLQQKILQDYLVMLKPGGVLVYSTCSILPSENEEQIKKFLVNNPSMRLLDEQRCWPTEGFDGFYMAKLQRPV